MGDRLSRREIQLEKDVIGCIGMLPIRQPRCFVCMIKRSALVWPSDY